MNKKIIELSNINLTYPNGKLALKDINLTINEGEFLVISGESGSGKTSLINTINGIATRFDNCSYTGEVFIKDLDNENLELYEISREISNVFQNPKTHFFNVDTTSELLFYLENRGFKREIMQKKLDELLKTFPIDNLLNRNIFKLSGGEKQILSIASSFIADTDIVVLDEPSSNLDHKYTKIVSKMLRELKNKGKTIIISEHRFYFLRNILDRVIHIKDGRILKEFTREEFYNLSEKERVSLGLRSIIEPKIQISKDYLNKEGSFQIKKLHYEFGNQKRGIHIENLNFNVGDIVGIIGENGVGKSTFLSYLLGLKRNADLIVYLNGKKINKTYLTKIGGLVMQDVNHQLFADTVEKELTLGLKKSEIDYENNYSILESLGILTNKAKHPMSLSGGQKQRVAIASVVSAKPKLICFDEPTSGMDYNNMIKISNLIKKISKNNIIFIVSHDYEFLNKTVNKLLNMQEYSIYYEKI